MNAQTNAASESHFATAAIADPTSRPTRPFFWSVRRELWENRWIYIVPLAAAALAILGTLLAGFRGKGVLWTRVDNMQQQWTVVAKQCDLIGLLIMGVTFVVAIFYCLDAIYGERRDRSIFFWKSLPVSDTVTVLSKASIPLVIIPLLTFAIAALTQWIVLAIDAASLAALGRSLSPVTQLPLLQIQAGLLYHLIAVHSLWYAPLFAYLLLISAWARRVPILWAILPPLAIEIVEKLTFGTSYFAHYLGYRFAGGSAAGTAASMNMGAGHFSGMNPGAFLASPGLWGGLLVAALFLAAAIQLRRYRAPN